jgi:hypothetical protein
MRRCHRERRKRGGIANKGVVGVQRNNKLDAPSTGRRFAFFFMVTVPLISTHRINDWRKRGRMRNSGGKT